MGSAKEQYTRLPIDGDDDDRLDERASTASTIDGNAEPARENRGVPLPSWRQRRSTRCGMCLIGGLLTIL